MHSLLPPDVWPNRIRRYLIQKVAVLAANALVSSRCTTIVWLFDYWNSLFRGLPCFNQRKLQSIHNTLIYISSQIIESMIMLQPHWLPVNYHCMFKTTTLVYKFCGSPSYFGSYLFLSSYAYSTTRSHSDHQYLTVPHFHSSLYKSV